MFKKVVCLIDLVFTLIPRLRRLGRLLTADPARADSALLASLPGIGGNLHSVRDESEISRRLYTAAIAGFEADARAMNRISILPVRGALPPLLPAVWSLPYDERLAACLLIVDNLDLGDASAAANLPTPVLRASAGRALARLTGDLPFTRRVGRN